MSQERISVQLNRRYTLTEFGNIMRQNIRDFPKDLMLLAALLLAFVADFGSKAMVTTLVDLEFGAYQPQGLIGIHRAYNYDGLVGAFGIFMDPLILKVLMIAATAGIIPAVYATAGKTALGAGGRIGLGLMLGGAIGNTVDFIADNRILDFIHVHYAVANVADIAVFIGAGILIRLVISRIRQSRKPQPIAAN